MSTPEQLSDALGRDPMFAHDEHGKPITREGRCECGRRFSQTLLSERFLGIVEAKSAAAIKAVTETIPGYFVPVHCPSCERRDLGMQARLDESRLQRPHYTERTDDAA